MSEQQQQHFVEELQAELAKLRRVNSELLTKSSTRKAKLADAETKATDLARQLDESKQGLREATVSVPLRAIVENLSKTPALWLEQFSKQFDVEFRDGELVLLNKDGQLVADEKGQPIPVERESLARFVTTGDDSEATRLFQSITIVSRASGAGSSSERPAGVSSKQSGTIRFGLR